MSRRGNCWVNAVAESFFNTLKTQLTHHVEFKTYDQAEIKIFKYIEAYYNRRRKHSTDGMVSILKSGLTHTELF